MENAQETNLHVALVGGGPGAVALMAVLEDLTQTGFQVEIVGLADINPQAEGAVYAQVQGIFFTKDYTELLDINHLDLIIELTGRAEILEDLARRKPPKVGLVDHNSSLLFFNLVSFGQKISLQEQEISISKSFARALMNATKAGILVIDSEYRILMANDVAARRSGLTRKEAVGKYCFQVLHQAVTPCGGPDRPCAFQKTLESGEVAHALHTNVDAQGRQRIFDMTTYPLLDSNGDVIHVVDIFRDVTADLSDQVESRTRAIKEDLARLVQEDKLVSLGKLVASVAHEINNPIGSIINFNQLMLKTVREGRPDDKELTAFEKYLDLSVREAKRCGTIVNSLLSFSRQQVMEHRLVDLAEILDLIMVLTSHRFELAGVKIRHELGRGPFEVWGDYAQLQQCFMNLTFNAIEAMPEGGQLTISGGRSRSAKAVWVEISDTGSGIPEEIKDRIFEPFFSTKTAVNGVGLGLSMVYGIIREHRGAIELDSAVGVGTTFRVTLPSSAEVDLTRKEAN